MAEIKRTFTGGKMNKDLDERLVRPGEYRNAKNIQVRTTDGDASGTVQNIQGNKLVGSSYFSQWMSEQSDATNVGLSGGQQYAVEDPSQYPHCMASISDEKNDKAYFFFAQPLFAPNPNNLGNNVDDIRYYADTIIEQDADGSTVPVVVDLFGIVGAHSAIFAYASSQSFNEPFSNFNVSTATGSTYRPGMKVTTYGFNQNKLFESKIKAVAGDSIMLTDEVSVGNSSIQYWTFEGERVLNFNSPQQLGTKNFITGINVIDDLLFWTDSHSEPKKISISRCKAGTNIGGVVQNLSAQPYPRHTKLYVKDPLTNQLVDAALIHDNLDSGDETDGSGVDSYLKESHVTVMRKAPNFAPTLHMKQYDRVNTTDYSVTYSFINTTTNPTLNFGDIKVINSQNLNESQFRKDDILIITETTELNVIIKAKFICYEDSSGNEVQQTTSTIRIEIISSGSVSDSNTNWNISLQQKKPLFEKTLARFGYRYKYTDGEYSSFSPWSELAFIPGKFDYTSKKAHNLGMSNQVRELVIKDFVPYTIPLDVVAVDILYKTTESANVYIVETVEKEKNSEWQLFSPDGSENTTDIKTGELSITSEMIHRVLPSNQILRSWDNVPRYALAQEIVGSRLVYGNYVQGYDLGGPIQITQKIDSKDVATTFDPKKSIKTIRNYKIGLVYGDKYGRETPVVTSGYSTSNSNNEYSAVTGDLNVPKTLSKFKNSLTVSQSWGNSDVFTSPPDWMDYVKYYVKETSNEYYNLIMDRWYWADDSQDNIWLSFNSADRNKVDEETYLILKNSNTTNNAILEKARYKIIAIENEAPDFIKENFGGIGRIEVLPSTTDNSIWPTAISGTATAAGSPEGLYNTTIGTFDSLNSITIKANDWDASGVGVHDNDDSIFGRRINGRVRFRIVGESVETVGDTSTVTGKIQSEWRVLSHFAKSKAQDGTTDAVTIRWSKRFDQADVDMLSLFTSNASSFIVVNNLRYTLEFEESVKNNRPEFDGRFFVKIEKDETINNSVALLNIGVNVDWGPDDSFELSYIEDSFNNQHQQNVPVENIEYQAVLYQNASWFGGAFSTINPDLLSISADANGFQTLGTNTDIVSTINPVIQDLIDVEDGLEFSAFGACDVGLNNRVSEFWDYYNAHNDGVSNERVFIDSVGAIGRLAGNTFLLDTDIIAPSLLTGGAAESDDGTGMQTLFPQIDDLLYGGNRYKTQKVVAMQPGFILHANFVGATQGTIGCIGFSFNIDTSGGAFSFINRFETEMATDNYFSFSNNLFDENNKPIIYKILGKPISSHIDINTYAQHNAFVSPNSIINVGTSSITGEGSYNPTQFNEDTLTPFVDEENDSIDLPFEDHNICNNYVNAEPGNIRRTIFIEFRRVDPDSGVVLSTGLNLSEFDPRAYLHHDGRDSIGIQKMILVPTTENGESVNSEKGACWETEPKENVNLDLYYEASNAIPMVLSESNAFNFAPINSKVSISRLVSGKNGDFQSPIIESITISPAESTVNEATNEEISVEALPPTRINHRVNNIHFTSNKETILSLISTDNIEYELDGITPNTNFGTDALIKTDIAIGDNIFFTHKDSTVTSTKILNYYEPVNPPGGSTTDDNNFTELTTSDELIGVNSGPKSFRVITPSSMLVSVTDLQGANVIVDQTSTALIPVNSFITSVSYQSASTGSVSVNVKSAVSLKHARYAESIDATVYIFSSSKSIWYDELDIPDDASLIFLNYVTPTGYYGISNDVWNNPVTLPWHNCYSFGNGVESDRINDDFNAPQIDNGVKVSTTFSGYKEEKISSGLIYSGLYNSTSQVNNLNEFNMAEKITKNLNPTYGSIQALKTRNSDIVVLAEDKILKVLANKDAVFNADGNPQLTATDRVLGQTIPFVGDYGISRNPESLASDQYRLYFSDKQRGAVLRLSRDGLTPISSVGMKTWFKDNLKQSKDILGTFDSTSGEYNITITSQNLNLPGDTVSFNEASKGWVSFKSFIPHNGTSVAGKYFTAKNNNIYEHHVDIDGDSTPIDRNTFYGNFEPSILDIVFNDEHSSVKSFKYINYEGTESKITQQNTSGVQYYTGQYNQDTAQQSNVSNFSNWDKQYYNLAANNGWYTQSISTDLQQGSIHEFIKKEGKYFNNIKGTTTVTQNVDTSEFTVQGIGQVSAIDWVDPGGGDDTGVCVPACGPNEYCNNGECEQIVSSIVGCMDPLASNYNANATTNQTTSSNNTPVIAQCLYDILGCTEPQASNYNYLATTDDGTCNGWVVGCMDTTALNFNSSATIDGGYVSPGGGAELVWYTASSIEGMQLENPSCNYEVSIVYGCIDENALNYDENANVSAGPDACNYLTIQDVYGCPDPLALNYIENVTIETTCCYADNNQDGICDEDQDQITGCMDPLADNYDPAAIFSAAGICEYYTIEWCPDGTEVIPGVDCVEQVFGCGDTNACNYGGELVIDDGSCIFASDYESGYCEDICPSGQLLINGVCTDVVEGCLDPDACNYNPAANQNCGELSDCCTYETDTIDCNGNIIEDTDESEPQIIQGCLDPTALNYNCNDGQTNNVQAILDGLTIFLPGFILPATVDGTWPGPYGCDQSLSPSQTPTANSGNCIPIVYGCMDDTWNDDIQQFLYVNYNPNANVQAVSEFDGTNPCSTQVIVYGCQDPEAQNYDPLATFSSPDYPCEYASEFNIYGCTDSTAFNYNADATIDDGSCLDVIFGCTDSSACNYNSNANEDDGSCVPNGTTIGGCMDESDPNFNPCATISDPTDCINYVEDVYEDQLIYGCMDSTMFNYDPTATAGDSGTYCTPFIYGCTDNGAYNFNPSANTDDASCIDIVGGCTDPTSFNFNPDANTDDSSCIPFIYGCMNSTAFNYNNYMTTINGYINSFPLQTQPLVTDENAMFINVNTPAVLGGQNDCVAVHYGCMDASASNYNPLANTPFTNTGDDSSAYGQCVFENFTLIIENWQDDVVPYSEAYNASGGLDDGLDDLIADTIDTAGMPDENYDGSETQDESDNSNENYASGINDH